MGAPCICSSGQTEPSPPYQFVMPDRAEACPGSAGTLSEAEGNLLLLAVPLLPTLLHQCQPLADVHSSLAQESRHSLSLEA